MKIPQDHCSAWLDGSSEDSFRRVFVGRPVLHASRVLLADFLGGKPYVYELERCCGPDVVALQFADDKAADNFGRAIRRAASRAAERRASFTDADALISVFASPAPPVRRKSSKDLK